MVVLVLAEVIREFGDPPREDRHLDLDRPFVGLVPSVFLDYRRLRRLVQLVSVSRKIRNSNTEQLGGKGLAYDPLMQVSPTIFRMRNNDGRKAGKSIARRPIQLVVRKRSTHNSTHRRFTPKLPECPYTAV